MLLETLVAISLISVVMAAFTTFFINSVAFTSQQRATQGAIQIANSAVEDIRALPSSDVFINHDAASVATQFAIGNASPVVRPWLSSMVAATDPLALTAGSGATAAVKTVAVTLPSVNNIAYSVSDYIGFCVIPTRIQTNATCGLGVTANGVTTIGIPYLRAVVVVTWPGSQCPLTVCTYITASLISATDDPLFNQSQAPAAAPTLTNPGPQVAAVGDVVSLAATFTGVPSVRFAVTGGNLPVGLYLDAATGRIGGTPTAVTLSSTLTLTLTDGFARAVSVSFAWTVVPALTGIAPAPQAGIIGVAVAALVVSASGGELAYTWSDPGATLPAGLSLSTINNQASITGTPTTVKQYDPVTLTVTDLKGRTSTISFTWTIDYPPFSATNPGSQTSTINTPDTVVLSAVGGSGSFAWTGGATLPAGLTLTPTGAISGSPTVAGVTSVTLQVADTKALVQKPITMNFSWTVYAKPTVTSPGNQIVTVGQSISVQLTTSCPNGPCTYALVNGPTTLAISNSGLLTGLITSGAQIFTAATVTVTDNAQATITSDPFSWTVVGGVPSAPLGVTVVNGDTAVTAAWTAPTAGTGTPVYTATVGPGGPSCTTTALSCVITGLTNGIVYSLTVTATNTYGTGPASTPVQAIPYPAGVMSPANGMTLWLDAADPTSLYASSSCTAPAATTTIGCWKDKSGQANNFSQLTVANQPVVGAKWNGLTAANFVDTTDVLNSVKTNAAYQTVFTAANLTTSNTYNYMFGQADSDNNNVRVTAARGSPNGNDFSYNTGTPPLNWTNGAQGVNAALPQQVITSDQAASVKSFSASVSNTFSNAGVSRGLVGQVGEVITFSGVLTTTQRRSIEEYLSNKWRVPIAPAPSPPCTPDAGFSNCASFAYSGADQTFTVPTNVTSLKMKAWGAGGGGVDANYSANEAGGGGGGYSTGTLAVTAAQSLTVVVGQGGHSGTNGSTAATYGGGGAGGSHTTTGTVASDGGSGGGYSGVFISPDKPAASTQLISGGGGGAAPGVSQSSSVELGTAKTYSALGTTVVNGGVTTLTGDIGTSPNPAIVGFPPGTLGGTMHAGDPQAAQALADMVKAYNDAAGRTPTGTFAGDLNGRTFTPGVYNTGAAMALTGTLTLDGQGNPNAVFIFQVGGALNTAAASTVVLVGGAQASHVIWQSVGAAGTGASSSFSGTILANGAITIGAGGTLIGRALSRGAVTLASNTISSVTTGPDAGGGGGVVGGQSSLTSTSGQGGTQSAGGTAAAVLTGCSGTQAGSQFRGGNGGAVTGTTTLTPNEGGGGGGAGWFGGGGGRCHKALSSTGANDLGGTGGGGSSHFTNTGMTSGNTVAGTNGTSGNPGTAGAAGNNADGQYVAGVGVGGSVTVGGGGNGGNGLVVFEWALRYTPQAVAVTNGDTQVNASWAAPSSSNDGVVTSYTASLSPGGGSCTTTGLSCPITGLTNGIVYSLTVTATNSTGTGPASAAVNAIPYPAGVMSAANGLTLWLDGADPNVLLSSCGGAVTTTTIGCWKDKSGQAENFSQGTAANQPGVGTWHGLPAANFADSGDVLNSINATGRYQSVFVAANVTNLATQGDKVVELFGQADTDYTVRIGATTARSNTPYPNSLFNLNDWSYNTGNPPLNWTNGAQAVNAIPPSGVITFDEAQSPQTFTASVSNTKYNRGLTGQVGDVITFNKTLSATDRRTVEQYLSNKWGVTIATQPLSAPQAPTSVIGTRLGNSSAKVSWAAPSFDGGNAISGYTVTSTIDGRVCTTPPGTLTCSPTGLTRNSNQIFTVTATNSIGAGPASDPSASVAL